MPNLRKFDEEFAQTNRLRTEGTENLLIAAAAGGVRRFVAQSYTGWPNARVGGRVKTEEDPLDADPPKQATQTLAAIKQLESRVAGGTGAAGVEGIILRYGSFYGPGTAIMRGSELVEAVRTRTFPIIGGGGGVWSFIQIDDAAEATRMAVERALAGIYNIVDDDPAEVSVWLPELALLLGAKPPYHVPAWIGRFIIGEAGLLMMTEMRGSSNAKAKRVLGWQPAYASWRDGFRRW